MESINFKDMLNQYFCNLFVLRSNLLNYYFNCNHSKTKQEIILDIEKLDNFMIKIGNRVHQLGGVLLFDFMYCKEITSIKLRESREYNLKQVTELLLKDYQQWYSINRQVGEQATKIIDFDVFLTISFIEHYLNNRIEQIKKEEY